METNDYHKSGNGWPGKSPEFLAELEEVATAYCSQGNGGIPVVEVESEGEHFVFLGGDEPRVLEFDSPPDSFLDRCRDDGYATFPMKKYRQCHRKRPVDTREIVDYVKVLVDPTEAALSELARRVHRDFSVGPYSLENGKLHKWVHEYL